jgi:uncharacterized protein involved in tolerance to divalent cations
MTKKKKKKIKQTHAYSLPWALLNNILNINNIYLSLLLFL